MILDLIEGTKVVYKGETGVIIGVDAAGGGPNNRIYLVAIKDFLGETISQSSSLSYCRIQPDTQVYGNYGYVWATRNDLKTYKEEETEILADLNHVYVRRFKSGAVRSDDRGRERPSFISPYALKFLAEHFSVNASFFNDTDSAKNYMKGIEPKDIEDSLERHVIEFKFAMLPGKEDKKAIKDALVSIMANATMALHQIGLEEDGLYKEIYDKTEYIKMEDK